MRLPRGQKYQNCSTSWWCDSKRRLSPVSFSTSFAFTMVWKLLNWWDDFFFFGCFQQLDYLWPQRLTDQLRPSAVSAERAVVRDKLLQRVSNSLWPRDSFNLISVPAVRMTRVQLEEKLFHFMKICLVYRKTDITANHRWRNCCSVEITRGNFLMEHPTVCLCSNSSPVSTLDPAVESFRRSHQTLNVRKITFKARNRIIAENIKRQISVADRRVSHPVAVH